MTGYYQPDASSPLFSFVLRFVIIKADRQSLFERQGWSEEQ
jgi:hypothetical protein